MPKASSDHRATIRPRSQSCLWQRARSFVLLLLCCGIPFWIVDVKGNALCPPEESVDITAGMMQDNGSIAHDGILYEPRQHFQDDSTVFGCVCLVRQCVRLCCPLESETLCMVEALNVNFSTPPYDGSKALEVKNLREDSKYHFLNSPPHCKKVSMLHEHEYVFRADGALAHRTSLYREFCLLVSNTSIGAGYCEAKDLQDHHRWYAMTIAVSLPFLVATFVVYALLPEMQNIPGKSLMCYVAALTVGYLLVALMRSDVYTYQSVWCAVTGNVMYFALLASFFWLNVMAFDIFWTFSGSRGRTSERRKFLYYSLYAWGFPLVLLAWVLLVDHTDFMHQSLRPEIGRNHCFLRTDKLITFVYFYLPLGLLVGVNVYFFAVTAFRIYRMKQAAATALSGDSRRHTKLQKDSNRFSLYLRLFIIMGVSWTIEFGTWLFDDNKKNVLIFLADFCNCISGIFIFFFFVWKQKVKDLLLKRFGRQPAALQREPNTNTTRTTRNLTLDTTVRSLG